MKSISYHGFLCTPHITDYVPDLNMVLRILQVMYPTKTVYSAYYRLCTQPKHFTLAVIDYEPGLNIVLRILRIMYSETHNNEYIERVHQMSYSSLSDNGMLQIFSFFIE